MRNEKVHSYLFELNYLPYNSRDIQISKTSISKYRSTTPEFYTTTVINKFSNFLVYEMGDDVSDILQEKTLLLANHQSTSDVPLMMNYFISKRGTTRHVMWIMDKLFKFTNFGLVSIHHGDFFIVSVSTALLLLVHVD